VNIWQSYKQEGGCFVPVARLVTKMLVTITNIHGFKNTITDGRINKRIFNLVVDNPSRLKDITTVPGNLSLLTTLIGDCRSFSDISVP